MYYYNTWCIRYYRYRTWRTKMPDNVTILYQQTLQTPSLSTSSVSIEPIRAGVEDALGTGINYVGGTVATGVQVGVSASLGSLLKQLLCQGNLSNNDLFNNTELNCAVAMGAASLACGGVSGGGLVSTEIFNCVAPQVPIVDVTNNGSDCSIDFSCGCASDTEGPVEPTGFDPQEVADSISECQAQIIRDHLNSLKQTEAYTALKNATINSVVGNIFAANTLTTLFNQIDASVGSATGATNIGSLFDTVIFNTSYFMSPAFRIIQLLNTANPGSGDAFAAAWNNLGNLYQQAITDINNTCALTVEITAQDVSTFLSSITFNKKKKCSSAKNQRLNPDTCECECLPDHQLCSKPATLFTPALEVCIPCASPKIFDTATCGCKCPEGYYEIGGSCVQKCPEGTILKTVPCDGPHSQVAFMTDGNSFITKCFDCFCRKDVGVSGTVFWPFLPDNAVPALDCGEGEIRLNETDCECDCDREKGYYRVWDPSGRFSESLPLPESRCRLPCEPNKIYIWELDECVCPNRVYYSAVDGFFLRLYDPWELCGDADGQFGKVWSDEYCSCVCPSGIEIFDPETGICGCPSGMVPDQETMSCICPSGTEMVGSGCVPVCDEGQFRNSDGECEDICPSGTIYIDGLCLPIDGSGSGSGDIPWSGSGSGSGSGYNF